MEESPHKCPVCSRSFNQRSNLKTHLLTHTDHKPYECNACGKVFRRNCDLRRHALTHSVADVPGSEPLDPSLGDQNDILSGDEDDTVVEVDSPIHSPANQARSPSPVHVTDDLRDEEENLLRHDEEEEGPPPTPAPIIEKDHVEVTHCHHERSNGSKSPYTMRPQNNYEREYKTHPSPASALADYMQYPQEGPLSLKMHPSSVSRTDVFVPTLHVRRDLHQKLGRGSISGALDPQLTNYIAGVPIRKRPMGPDGEPQLPLLYRGMIPSLHRQQSLLKPPDDLLMPPILASPDGNSRDQISIHPSAPPLIGSPTLVPPLPVPSGHFLSPSSVQSQQPSTASTSTTNQSENASQPPPPKRTGFSIEDIMRR